jgi:hypothetical protein
MKKLSTVLALVAMAGLVTVATAANNSRVTSETGIHGVVINPNDGGDCGALSLNADGSYENGYAWQYQGSAPPYYGAFAECYSGSVGICAGVYDLTQTGSAPGHTQDDYVWDDNNGLPGAVKCVKAGQNPGTIAFWPSLSRHVINFDAGCCETGNWWVGFWGNWPGTLSGWYIGADLDGFGGCPVCNFAPGIGYPTGWGSVNLVFYFSGTQALGIGVETVDCGPVATEKTTWGNIKNLYR